MRPKAGAVKTDALAVLDRVYDLDATPIDWLRGVGTAFYEQLGAGLGWHGFYYDVRRDLRIEVGRRHHGRHAGRDRRRPGQEPSRRKCPSGDSDVRLPDGDVLAVTAA